MPTRGGETTGKEVDLMNRKGSGPAPTGPLSDEDFVQQHKLAELFDMLIYQVSTFKPKHPAAHMALTLRERIEAREGTTKNTQEDGAPQHLEAPTATNKSAVRTREMNNMDFSNSLSTVGEEPAIGSSGPGFCKFGIWIHVQTSDIPLITARFHEQCMENNVSPPQEFTVDTPELLRILSRATSVYFFNGFTEARKQVPLRPHKNAPACCTYLSNAILSVITIATLSQRRSFTTFMHSLIEELRVDDIDEIRETARFWSSFRQSPTFQSSFVSKIQLYARQFDLLLGFDRYLDVFMQWVDSVIDQRDMSARERQEMLRSTYAKIPTRKKDPRFPDLFSIFASSMLCSLREGPEAATIPERTFNALTKVLLLLLEDENAMCLVTAKEQCAPSKDGGYLRVRRADASAVKLLSRLFSNGFRNKFAEEHGSSRMTLEYFFMMKSTYSEEHSEAFITVSSAVLRLEQKYLDSENFSMRCNAHSRLKLLELFIQMVSQRHILTMDEVEFDLLRTRCCGVTIGTFLVYLCELFRLTRLPEKMQKNAKFVLTTLQEICVDANASPVISEFSASFHLLAEAAEHPDAFLEAFLTVPPFDDIPITFLIQFFDLPMILKQFSECFDGQAINGPEQYFNTCLLLVTRMRVARIHCTATCNFLPLAILSGVHFVSEKVPLYSLLPACEALAGLGPSLDLPVTCGLSKADRVILGSFFHQNRSARAFVTAVQIFLEAYPDFRHRISRPAISYERVQRYFYAVVQELLRLESENEKSTVLRMMAIDLAAEGMLPRDYDLFALALTHALRIPGFPEAIWNTFMFECIEKMKDLTPPLRPLSSYANALPKISIAQRCVRRYIRRRTAGMKPKDLELLNRLLEELSAEAMDDSISDDIQLSETEAQLVCLTWRLLDNLNKAHAVYSGIQAVAVEGGQPRPPSSMVFRSNSIVSMNSSQSSVAHTNKYQIQYSVRAEARSTFKKCKAIAELFTRFINIVCSEKKGRDWVEVWDNQFDRNFRGFFDDLIAPQEFMTFAMPFIETIRKYSVVQHSTMRVIWSSFVSCFNRMIMTDQHFSTV